MAQIELIMPKMGESITEATVLKWVKNVGDSIDVDETVLEIATDKVDSEVPSPVAGVLSKILFQENDVVEVGKAIAVIATEGEAPAPDEGLPPQEEPVASSNGHKTAIAKAEAQPTAARANIPEPATGVKISGSRFYSPLVKNIAKAENIGVAELEQVPGSGKGGRLTKKDILSYLENRTSGQPHAGTSIPQTATITAQKPTTSVSGAVEIVEMDRMRKLIADHMVMSKRVSPHVTSFVEVDVTGIVEWRNKNKESFQQKYGEKITFTPIFVEAVVKAIGDYPMVNISMENDKILVHKDLNIGMATALPSGNLIVPVIKAADQLNLVGLAKNVNDLARRARNNKLKPDDIQGGTFTLTNVGTFGNVMGTPIINQPQVAILATGAIRKKPAVVETEYGDLIAVRQMMFLSLSYDHRVVDGFLGGSFLRRIGDYLEDFDKNREV